MGASTEYGVQVLFQNQVLYDRAGGDMIAGMKAHVDAAAELGVKLIRFPGDWRAMQPDNAATTSADYLKQVTDTLAYAKGLGISVIMTFAQTPFWATSGTGDPNSQAAIWSPPTGAAADAYASALVKLYDTIKAAGLEGTVKAWEIWNEPNTTTFWPTANLRPGTDVQVTLDAAAQYVELLNTAYDALKAKAPSAVVLGGSLAACDTDYLKAMYAAGAKFDGFALHPYTKANPFHGGVAYGPSETDAADALSSVWSFKSGVEDFRNVMVANGDADKHLWFTEFGWSSTSAWGGAGSAAAQAEFLGQALNIIKGWDFVDAAIAYRLFDGQGEEFGMRAADGTLKASGAVFKDFLTHLSSPGGSSPAAPAATTIIGTNAADTLSGTEAQNTIVGNGGNDRIDGKGGNDIISGGAGDNWIFGGAGNDRITGGADCDWIEGGAGADVLVGGGYHGHILYWSSTTGVSVNLSSGRASGGDAQGDNFSGIIAVDGSQFSDALTGNSADNWLIGLGGNDQLSALAGRDRVEGGAGNDVITGGYGADQLSGGAGRDVFNFDSLLDSGTATATRDLITDFTRGQDRIDLATIDANTRLSGDQAFRFIGTQGFHAKAGELHTRATASGLILEGDINGDGRADFQIDVATQKYMITADFVL